MASFKGDKEMVMDFAAYENKRVRVKFQVRLK